MSTTVAQVRVRESNGRRRSGEARNLTLIRVAQTVHFPPKIAHVDCFQHRVCVQLDLGPKAELVNIAGALILVLPVAFLNVERRHGVRVLRSWKTVLQEEHRIRRCGRTAVVYEGEEWLVLAKLRLRTYAVHELVEDAEATTNQNAGHDLVVETHARSEIIPVRMQCAALEPVATGRGIDRSAARRVEIGE